MARRSSVNNNLKRKKMADSYSARRKALKEKIMDKNTSFEERMDSVFKLASLPRNSAKIRVRNRCEFSGRPRGYHRKFGLSRIAIRELASNGMIPGMIKASW